MTRITIRIDAVTSDTRGLDRPALEAALRTEAARLAAEAGRTPPLRTASTAVVRQALPAGGDALPGRVAAAAMKGVRK